MSPPRHNQGDEESQARDRHKYQQRDEGCPDRATFIHLSERVAELEAKIRMLERQHIRDIESIERRVKEDFEEVKSSVQREITELRRITSSLDKSAQAVSIAIAEIKIRSGMIGAISSGVTVFLIMAFEWLQKRN